MNGLGMIILLAALWYCVSEIMYIYEDTKEDYDD